MPRMVRNTLIQVATEPSYGGTVATWSANNAVLAGNLSINPFNGQGVDRGLVRPYLGGSELLPGTRYVECSFEVEAVGAGTTGATAPYAPSLLACGMVETLNAAWARYDPMTGDGSSIAIRWFDDGVFHLVKGCRGSAQLMLKAGEKPKLAFKFQGLYVAPTALATPASDFTAYKTPQVVSPLNTGDLIIGGTLSVAAAPAITGGTPYVSQGIELDLGNSVQYTPLIGTGGESVDITDRSATAKIQLRLTAAQEVALMGLVESAATSTLALRHGTVAKNSFLLWAPAAQFTNPQKSEVNGQRLISFDLRLVPKLGNDEVSFITSF